MVPCVSAGDTARVADEHEAELERAVAKRWRVGALLTAVMMLGYFGFILLVAFAKPFVGTLLADRQISAGIIIGASVIILAPVLTAIYVRWANRVYDPAIEKLRKKS